MTKTILSIAILLFLVSNTRAQQTFTVIVDHQPQVWHEMSPEMVKSTMMHLEFIKWFKPDPTQNFRFFKEKSLRTPFKTYPRVDYVKKRK